MVPYGSTKPKKEIFDEFEDEFDEMEEWDMDRASSGCGAFIWMIIAALVLLGIWKLIELIGDKI